MVCVLLRSLKHVATPEKVTRVRMGVYGTGKAVNTRKNWGVWHGESCVACVYCCDGTKPSTGHSGKPPGKGVMEGQQVLWRLSCKGDRNEQTISVAMKDSGLI